MITITSLWIVALVLLLLFLARSVRTVRRAIRCPLRGSDLQVSFLGAEPEGRPIEVIACTPGGGMIESVLASEPASGVARFRINLNSLLRPAVV